MVSSLADRIWYFKFGPLKSIQSELKDCITQQQIVINKIEEFIDPPEVDDIYNEYGVDELKLNDNFHMMFTRFQNRNIYNKTSKEDLENIIMEFYD